MSQPDVNLARAASGRKLRITLRKSTIGQQQDQKDTARALGLTRLNRAVVRPDNPAVRGMIQKLRHLVVVTEIPDGSAEDEPKTRRG
jgi:large subunit ribosomal protein L30